MGLGYRRNFLKSGLKVAAVASCTPVFSVGPLASGFNGPRGRSPLEIQTLIRSQIDTVDRDVRYLSVWPDAPLSLRRSLAFIDNTLAQLRIPPGEVIEVGSYRGQCLERLCEVFGRERCTGFDIYNYQDHPQKRILDIRQYRQRHSIALGWNQASMWSSNPRSKLAAHRFLVSNIVPGGFLVEDNLNWMPHDVQISGFQIVHEDRQYTILKKA